MYGTGMIRLVGHSKLFQLKYKLFSVKDYSLSLSKGKKIVYWGAGHICNKAFEVSGIKPDLIIDNNINLTGVSQLDCLVKHPSEVTYFKTYNCYNEYIDI